MTLFAVLLLLAFQETGWCLNCYFCDTTTGTMDTCGLYTFSSSASSTSISNQRDVYGTVYNCSTCVTIASANATLTSVTRTCQLASQCSEVNSVYEGKMLLVTCCYTDLCNAALHMNVTTTPNTPTGVSTTTTSSSLLPSTTLTSGTAVTRTGLVDSCILLVLVMLTSNIFSID